MSEEHPTKPEPPKIRMLCSSCGADQNVSPCNCSVTFGVLLTLFCCAVVFDIVVFTLIKLGIVK